MVKPLVQCAGALVIASLLFALGGVCVLGASIADPDAPLTLEERVRRAAMISYVHGMTKEIAHREVGAEGVPYLLELLRDPDFPRRDNVVAMLAFLGSDTTTRHLLDFVEAPPASPAIPAEDRALLLTGDALGRIASRGNPSALNALLDMVEPGGRGGILHEAVLRGAYPVRMRDDLIESAVRGLGLVGSDSATHRLRELSEGRTQPVVESLELSSTARRVLEYEPRTPAAGHVDPAATHVPRRRLSGDPGFVTSTESAEGNLTVIESPISWARHIDWPYGDWDEERVDEILGIASKIGAQPDSDLDIECCMNLSQAASDHIFGTSGDGLDIISSEQDLTLVLIDPVARVKGVRAINWCGVSAPNILGCSYTPGNAIAVVDLGAVVNEARLWLHEFGHNVGLPHNNTSSAYVMYQYLSGSSDHLDAGECAEYRTPSVAGVHWLIIGPCDDGDGDGLLDHIDICPLDSDPGQADGDGDSTGDACDNCPDLTNSDQSDVDQDDTGDLCDNCPDIYNPRQSDLDNDTLGMLCDPCPDDYQNDQDEDGYCETDDNCPYVGNADQANSDGDDHGDVCDNCPETHNPTQWDLDHDTLGNECDPCPDDFENDHDGDGLCESDDNCPDIWNQDQADIDGDNSGELCDTCPGLFNPEQVGTWLAPADHPALYALSPDGAWVVLRQDLDRADVFELYSIPTQGGTPTKLNDPIPHVIDVTTKFAISADSSRVVYAQGHNELYSVPIEGGSPVKLSGAVHPSGMGEFVLSPDSSTVVYDARPGTSYTFELYSVPIGGGISTSISGPMVAGGLIQTELAMYAISPDSSRVVYVANQDDIDAAELYSVAIDGGAVVKLNSPLAGELVYSSPFAFSPDSSTVLYLAEQDHSRVRELFAVASDGGVPIKLNSPIDPPQFGISGVGQYAILPDGAGVLYLEDYQLYSVPITGGSVIVLSPAGEYVHAFEISPDGSRVVLVGDLDDAGEIGLFSVPIQGGTVTKLSGPPHGGIGVYGYTVSPDGSMVAYWAGSHHELYSVPTAGGEFTKLSQGDEIVPGIEPRFTLGGTRVVYSAFGLLRVEELHSVPAEGGPSQKISGQMHERGGILGFATNATSLRAVYAASQLTAGGLFSTLIDHDTDLDGRIQVCDCAPGDSTMWAAPGEATALRLQHDHTEGMTTLTWAAPADPGATTVEYDVLRSSDRAGFSTAGTCIESGDGSDTAATDSEPPGSSTLYFLVRGKNACPDGVGSLGADSNLVERDAISCP